MDIGVKIRQLINILFCGYRRSTIRDKCMPKPILARGTVPQRVINLPVYGEEVLNLSMIARDAGSC